MFYNWNSSYNKRLTAPHRRRLDPQTVYPHSKVDGDLFERLKEFANSLDNSFFSEFTESDNAYYLVADCKEARAAGHIIGSFMNHIHFFCEGTYGFFLKTGHPIAYCSFDMVQGDEFYIKQLQGVKGKAKELARIDWPAMFVSAILDFGKSEDLKKITIQPAKQNSWVKQEHIPLEKAVERYDNLAKKLRFRYNTTTLKYVKKIK